MFNTVTRDIDVSRYLTDMKDITSVSENEVTGVVPTDWKSVPGDYEITYIYILHYRGTTPEPLPPNLADEIHSARFNKNLAERLNIRFRDISQKGQRIGAIEVVVTQYVKGSVYDVKEGGVSLDHATARIESENNIYVDTAINRFNRIVFENENADRDGVHLVNFTRVIKYLQRESKTDEVITGTEPESTFTRQSIVGEGGERVVADTYEDTYETTIFSLIPEAPDKQYTVAGDEEDEDEKMGGVEDYLDEVDDYFKQSEPIKEKPEPVALLPEETGMFEDKIELPRETVQVQKREAVVDTLGKEYAFDLEEFTTEEPDYEVVANLDSVYEQPTPEPKPQRRNFGQAIGDAMRSIGKFLFRR